MAMREKIKRGYGTGEDSISTILKLNTKFFKIINRIMIFLLFFVLTDCQNYPNYSSGPSNSIKRFRQIINRLNVIFSYRINFNHIPLGYSDIANTYISDSLWSASNISFSTNSPPDSIYDNSLNFSSLSSFKSFYNAFLIKNGISAHDTILYSFGIKRALNTTINTYGYTFNFYYFRFNSDTLQGYPSMSFVQVENINSYFSAYTDTERKKLKNFTTAHELTHSRGLIDLTPQSNFDYVHDCHKKWNGNNDDYCLMHQSLSVVVNHLDAYYPPYLCDIHKRIYTDSLKNFIQTGLILPDVCQN
jgi:hypothetical protein